MCVRYVTPTAGSELSNLLGALVAAGVHMVDASTPTEYAANVKQPAGDLVDMLVAAMSERDTQEPPRCGGHAGATLLAGFIDPMAC